MKAYITRLYGYTEGVASLRQQTVADFAQEVNILPISLFKFSAENEPDAQLSSRLDGIMSSITWGDTVIVQTPIEMSKNYVDMFLDKLTTLRAVMGVKIVAFIHEVKDYLIDFYNNCDSLIVENESVLNYLKNHGLTNNTVEIFNFYDFAPRLVTEKVHFTGNKKANFQVSINYLNSTNSDQYFDQMRNQATNFLVYQNQGFVDDGSLQYAGDFDDDLLSYKLNKEGGFGLVMPPEKIDTVPFELSMFISAGLPVIALSGTAAGNLVINKKIGWVVNSIEEAANRLPATLDVEYEQLLTNVEQMVQDTRNGISIKNALIRSVFDANLPKISKAGE
ncbi:hypothetical protein [Lactobacillus kalixensis]|uniref:hypothetical protein n=1 Tax=Lactobacillus kalixensis TaxID=227944 RepID=UPI00070DEE1D|nr:hypothetical protein [Lactobacillus kalixensis]